MPPIISVTFKVDLALATEDLSPYLPQGEGSHYHPQELVPVTNKEKQCIEHDSKLNDKNKSILRECLQLHKDIVGNTPGDFRKLFGPELFIYMQTGNVRIIFDCSSDTPYKIVDITTIRTE